MINDLAKMIGFDIRDLSIIRVKPKRPAKIWIPIRGRQMTLTELAALDKWIELEKDIHQRSGLDVNVFDTKGYRISEIKYWANRLCPKLKQPIKDKVSSVPLRI